MNDYEQWTDEFMKTDEGIKELEGILADVEIDEITLQNIEKRVISNIKPLKQRNYWKPLIIAAAALILILGVYRIPAVNAWVKNTVFYSPSINKMITSKNEFQQPFYDSGGKVVVKRNHSELKINNFVYNASEPFLELEIEYSNDKYHTIPSNEWEKRVEEIISNGEVYLEVGKQKINLISLLYGSQKGYFSGVFNLPDGTSKLPVLSKGNLKLVVIDEEYNIHLKHSDSMYTQINSGIVKGTQLIGMVEKTKDTLHLNFVRDEEKRPFITQGYEASVQDKTGHKVLLKSNETGPLVRDKYKASIKLLKGNEYTLSVNYLENYINVSNATWSIPIPQKLNEEKKLADFKLPGESIALSGYTVTRIGPSEIEIHKNEDIPPKSDFIMELFFKNQSNLEITSSYRASTNDKMQGQFIPNYYTIKYKNENDKEVNLQITSYTKVQYGPWIFQIK